MNIINYRFITSLTFLISLLGCSPETPNSAQLYFDQLSQLCGSTFQGYSSFPEDPDHPFAGQLLVAHFDTCNDHEIRIPFIVGEDHSRTWVFTYDTAGLTLKHDHRHANGEPDEVNNYGGSTSEPGTKYSQSFPADAYTAKLIPDAATNMWRVSLSEDAQQLTYYLERNNQPRFKAELQRQTK